MNAFVWRITARSRRLLALGIVLLAGGSLVAAREFNWVPNSFEVVWQQQQQSPRPAKTLQPEEEGHRIAVGEKSAFAKWIESEGLPIYTGYVVDDVTKVDLEPWKRLGVAGATVYLNGDGGQMSGYIMEIAPGRAMEPEKHLYEEHTLVLSGSGETRVWHEGKPKVTGKWQKGSLFSVPLNAWHQHVNTGRETIRLIAVTNAPLMIDLFRNPDFIFRNPFRFTDRFDSQADFYKLEPQKTVPGEGRRHGFSITNIVPDVYSVNLHPAGHGIVGEGVETRDHHFEMSSDTLDAHVEEYQSGVYEQAHKHGAGDNVLMLRGTGYSLMWPASLGEKPFATGQGDKVVRVDWHAMTLFVPPLGWYHQHFNTGKTPARFVKLDGWENRVFPLTSKFTFNQTALSIEYKNEDPKIREVYEVELMKAGTPLRMPPAEQLHGHKH